MKKILMIFIGMMVLVGLIGNVLGLNVTQRVIVKVLPVGYPDQMNISSPIQDFVYDKRMVPINLSLSNKVNFLKYASNGDGMKTLCRNCDGYGYDELKKKPFSDGFHELRIWSMFDTGNAYAYLNFTVDTKRPRIKKCAPKKNKFTNGSGFYVKYTEKNIKEISVNWNPRRVLGECESGRNKKCYFDLDLNAYDGEKIRYWFEVEDIAGNNKKSRPVEIKVDVTAPVVNNPGDFWEQGTGRKSRYVYFDIGVTEKNFDKVFYMDMNSRRPRWKILCNGLRRRSCEKRKRFDGGSPNMKILIVDKAGNSVGVDL